jgi:glyoxylase-like metal-dependent hydrolase (beta-lactamase superfamily II)
LTQAACADTFPPVQMREIVGGVYALEGLKMGRSYLIDDREGLTLIDTSSAGASDAILAAIDQLRRPARDLTTIVATHYHHDHTGNVAKLRERTGATFCAHADDVPYIDGSEEWGDGQPSLAARFGPKPYALSVDRTLSEGDVLPGAGGLRVIHAPGHTPGHIALHSAERGIVFSGDAFMNAVGLRLPPSMSSHDMNQARATVRMLAGLEFEHALPGHGQPVMSRANEKLAQWARKWL